MSIYNVGIEGAINQATVHKEVTYEVSLTKVDVTQKETDKEEHTVIPEDAEPVVVVKLRVLADNTTLETNITCTCKTEPYKYIVSYIPQIVRRMCSHSECQWNPTSHS